MNSPNFGWHQILDYWEVLDYSASDLLHTQKIGQQRILDYCEVLDYSVCDYSEVRLYLVSVMLPEKFIGPFEFDNSLYFTYV